MIGARTPRGTTDALLADAVGVVARFLPGATAVALGDIPQQGMTRRHASAGAGHDALVAAQVATHEGPCLDAADHSGVVVVDDLAHERRWPQFVARMSALTPVRAVLSIVVVDRLVLSAVAERPRALSDHHTMTIALAAAGLTSMLLPPVRTGRPADQLGSALAEHRAVSMAQGVLMERHDLDADAAMALLTDQGARHGLTTPAAAAEVLRTRGHWPQP